jgi:hypothetical protein
MEPGTYWLVEMSARPGLSYRQAMKITQTSTAISNTLPGGAALGAGLQIAMYVSYGFARQDIALSLALTGIWNTFVKLGMPIVALLLLVIGGNAGGALVAVAVIGVLILIGTILAFAVSLRSERGAYASRAAPRSRDLLPGTPHRPSISRGLGRDRCRLQAQDYQAFESALGVPDGGDPSQPPDAVCSSPPDLATCRRIQ